MEKIWLVFTVLVIFLSPQFAHAEAPAMRQSTQASVVYGTHALQELRQSRHDLFQNGTGVLVTGVVVGSLADAAGIRISDLAKEEMGDVIVNYAGQPIDNALSFVTAVSGHSSANGNIDMVVVRNKAKVVVKLKSGKVGVQILAVVSPHLTVVSPPKGWTLDGGTTMADTDNKPQIFVQIGQASTAVAMSADGRFALSGSGNNVKLWDIASGREIRTFTGHTKRVTSVALSPNGRYALAGCQDGSWRLWEMATGETIYAIKGHPELDVSVAFSPDGRRVLSGGGKEVKLWDLATGLNVRTMVLPEQSSGFVRSVAFSPDGRQVLSTELYGTAGLFGKIHHVLRLWDVATGQHIRDLDGHSSPVNSVAFSPDGRQALSGGLANAIVKLWDLETGREIHSLNGHSTMVRSVAFSPDGKLGITAGGGGAKLWDLAAGKAVDAFVDQSSLPAGFRFSEGAVFSPDGRQVLSVGFGDILLLDVATGKQLRRFSGHSSELGKLGLEEVGLRQLGFSTDGGRIMSGKSDVMNSWDVATGRMKRVVDSVHTPEGNARSTPVVFSPDGRQMLSAYHDTTLKGVIELRDVITGKLIRTFTGHSGVVRSVAFSRDGRHVISMGTGKKSMWAGIPSTHIDGTIRLWDVATGENFRTLTGADTTIMHFVALSPDGKQLLSAGNVEALKLWDIESGTLVRTFKDFTQAATFSPDGRYALSAYMNTVRLLDLATGQEIRSFAGHSSHVNALAFSPDGKLALSGSTDNTAKLWDVATGKEIRTLVGHSGEVKSVSFSPDGRLVLTGSADTTARIWEAATGKEIIQMVEFDDGEWLSMTPEGYFSTSSPKAAENLNFRMGMIVYGIDQFYDVFYRPDIVEAALAGKDTAGMVTLTIAEAIKNPPPVIEKVEAPGPSAANTVKVTYRIKSSGGGIGEVRVFHNGKLVKSDGAARKMPDSLLGKKAKQVTSEVLVSQMRGISVVAVKDASLKGAVLTTPKPDLYESVVEIEPITGDNDISVVAFNAQNSIQSVASTVNFTSSKPPVAPRLYILAVGIDQYKDKSSNLKFAVKDSADIAARWKAQAATIYGEQSTFVETLSNVQATREGILGKINQIAARVKPTDHFLLFVASHGVLLGEQYYMVTSDYDGALQPSQLIGANEIVDFSKHIKALSQLYILDTCHAGGINGVVSGLYDARVSVLAKKMGLHVFASASSAEEALDGFEGNGLFTHTLLSGLNNNKQADTNSDKQISLIELGSYSKGQTKQIASRMLHKQDPLIINFGQDAPVYKLH